MAKKQKKQKAGMVKRRKQKQVKKAHTCRQFARRMPNKPNSERELEQLLQQLPTLAYEPEFNDLRFDPAGMQLPEENPDLEPELVKNLVTAEFLTHLHERLEQIENRTLANTHKNLMVKGLRHLLESQESFHFINPLIVALYLRTKAELAGESLELSQILKAVQAYETQHMSVIEDMIEATTPRNTEAPPTEKPLPFDEPPPPPSPVDPNLMEAYSQTLSKFDEATAERMREDVEVFVEDFVTQPPATWNRALVAEFFESWFVENLNPVADDLFSMQNSLEHFFQFLATQEQIPPAEMQNILALFQNDKEAFQQPLQP